MEKATSSLRRSGARLLALGTGHQELTIILSELKNLRSHTKAIRDSQQTVIQDMMNWACSEENRPLQDLFVYLLDLNTLWCEIQTQLADQIADFRHRFELILEGERHIDAARAKFGNCEHMEQKARKELKKMQRRGIEADVRLAQSKLNECERQKECTQAEVSDRIRDNEAVKLIRIKEGLLKLSEGYLTMANKCCFIYEAQRDFAKCLPDVEDREIHEIRYDGLSGAKEALTRAKELVKEYTNSGVQRAPREPLSSDPPPPYSPGPYYNNTPFNPYYAPVNSAAAAGPVASPSEPHTNLYPNIPPDQDLARAMNNAKI